MAFVELNPRYRGLLERHGLVTTEALLALPAVIVSGHPDRHVARVTLGTGPDALAAFLKREHCIHWKDRLLNAWAGFGFVTKSHREAKTLRALAQAGIGCPEWIAVGEDMQGRAFLLVRDLEGFVDLRLFLHGRQTAPARARRRFAEKLGAALAQLHNAGFVHPDLYSKHVLVHPSDATIRFLDWQRACPGRTVSWKQRWRDLAALDATLTENLANTTERIFCLRAYLRKCRERDVHGQPNLLQAAYQIYYRARRLLSQRRVRELRQLPLTAVPQRLVWLDGEALCVTPEFLAELDGRVPSWLVLRNLPRRPRTLHLCAAVPLTDTRQVLLTRRRENRLLNRLWARLRGGRFASPELRQASLIFRLERFGVPMPRLLAFGQRQVLPGWVESFLLTEVVAASVSLRGWLLDQARVHPDHLEICQRRRLVREVASLVRRVHGANCHWADSPTSAALPPGGIGNGLFIVQHDPQQPPTVVLGRVDGLRSRHRSSPRAVRKDLAALHQMFSRALPSRTDELRFLLAYLGLRRLTPAAKDLASSVLRVARPTEKTHVAVAPRLFAGSRRPQAEGSLRP
jgi:tRNA A-37 threonylcarbamoyl transferase component Bud32